MKKIVFLSLIILIITTSCSVQKRVYNAGYHITWNHSQKVGDQATISAFKTNPSEEITNLSLVLKADEENELVTPTTFPVMNVQSSNAEHPVQFSDMKAGKKPFISDIKEISKEFSERKKGNISKLKTFSSLKKRTKVPIDDTTILLYILCFILPPLAVGIVTDWDVLPLVISIILTCLFWVPGIIYAIYQVFKNT